MKLVIQIPCLNEEETLPTVLKELPKDIPGIDEISVLVVDDGSTDKTTEIALRYSCQVISHKSNFGLGVAFATGVDEALKMGADVLVNTDADNQYPSNHIRDLVKPIIENKADIVIGNRDPWHVKEFSLVKRIFQYIGNFITRRLIGVDVPDTVSGFRAYSREALLKLHLTTRFSYVLETIVQAAAKRLRIMSIDISVKANTRDSRLHKNIYQHMLYSGGNLLRVLMIYRPFTIFSLVAAVFAIPGIFLVARFFYYYFQGDGTGHVQSLVIAAILIVVAGMLLVVGIVAFLMGINRLLIERQLTTIREDHYKIRKK